MGIQVAGEVDSFKVLRRGFMLAVLTVGTLYIAVVIVVCAAFEWDDGVPTLPFALFLGGKTDSANSNEIYTGPGSIAAAILISMSAFGSLLSVSYTSVRGTQLSPIFSLRITAE
jgi:amino acid transporter